jgi:hypothetical protein
MILSFIAICLDYGMQLEIHEGARLFVAVFVRDDVVVDFRDYIILAFHPSF